MESQLIWLVIYLVIISSGIIAFMVYIHMRNKAAAMKRDEAEEPVDMDNAPQNAEAPAAGGLGARPRRGMRNVRARRDEPVAAAVVPQAQQEGPGSDDEEDSDADEKTGVDKRSLDKQKKKADRQAAREAEEQNRQDKQRKQQAKDEARRQKDEERERKRKEKEEEEARIAAEKKKKEEEEYDQWKDAFSVEEQGSVEQLTEAESQGLLQEFIDYIKKHKVVVLDDIAAEFNLKTQEVVDRIKTLEETGAITGVIDDRGKFIYISAEELAAIAQWIKKRGRVTITDVVNQSNNLVDLSTAAM